MPSGIVRVWIDGVAFESPYTGIESRQKAITKSILKNATIGSQISIDIIPNLHRKEYYVTEESKKGGYSWALWAKNFEAYRNRKNHQENRSRKSKVYPRPKRRKEGLCFKCIGIAVYIFSDRSTNHFVSN